MEFGNETSIAAAPNGLSGEVSDIYSLLGVKEERLSKGINLIRTKDGKVRKVMQR